MDIQPGQVTAAYGGITFGAVDAFGVDWSIGEDQFDGLIDGTGTTLSQQQRPRGSGAVSGAAFNTSRPFSIGGQIFAPTPEALTAAIDRLKGAVTNTLSRFDIFQPGQSRFVMARKAGVPLAKYVMPTIATWSISLATDDWRLFGSTLTGVTKLPSTAGGLTVPFTVPFTIASTVVSGQVALTNPGNEVGPVTVRIDGPCNGPIVTHTGSSGTQVWSSSLALGVGEFLLIDMERRTVLANGQSSRARFTTSRGWSGFDPGVNTFSFTASSFDAASQMTVTATPSWK